MARYDRISALFLIGIAFGICYESIRLGPGTLAQPGPGLTPLGSGLVLGIFGFIVFMRTFRRAKGESEVLSKQGTQWRKVILLVPATVCHAFLIDLLGFCLVTFLWMGYLYWEVGEMGFKKAVFASMVTTASSFLLFEYFLEVRFPKGVLGF